MKKCAVIFLFALAALSLVSCSIEDIPQKGNQDFKIYKADTADPLNGFRIDDTENRLLPSIIDHSKKMPVAKDQGQTGSCTSWAVGYYLKTYQEVAEEGWDKDENAFSPMYLFAMQCRHYSQPYSFIAAWDALRRYGCSKWSSMPYEDYQLAFDLQTEKNTFASMSIPEDTHAEARQYRCGEMYRLSNLNQIKKALTATPVLIAINHYSTPPRNPSPENNFISHDLFTEAPHVVICTGYDDQKFGVGALQFVNSCGKAWAENGYSWIKYPEAPKIIDFAMAIKDMPNSNATGFRIKEKPDSPCNVIASDQTGPYVDITWDKEDTARYYRIYRVRVDAQETYHAIGISYKNSYRDYPEPGEAFVYSVVSVNEIGESEHYATDNDSKGYADQGTARGLCLSKPSVTWVSNDGDAHSCFKISHMDGTATSMHVMVSAASEGPWHSLGWIAPGDFRINWARNSEYVGKRPYIRVRLCRDDGYSESSDPTHVAESIVSPDCVACIEDLAGSPLDHSIELAWKTDQGNADFFEVWRYRAAEDEANDWVLAGYAAKDSYYFNDIQALPGISYYYAVFGVYQGTYSKPEITEDPIKIPILQPNLHLYEFTCHNGHIITNPVRFNLTVWNEGGSEIQDYTIVILVYDSIEDAFRTISSVLNASDMAEEGQLPLQPGAYHTLTFDFNIPSEFADGRFYSWGIWIDYMDAIQEPYESDNFLESSDIWWTTNESLKQKTSSIEEADHNFHISNTRPFSKTSEKNVSFEIHRENAGAINHKRPSFCNHHAQ